MKRATWSTITNYVIINPSTIFSLTFYEIHRVSKIREMGKNGEFFKLLFINHLKQVENFDHLISTLHPIFQPSFNFLLTQVKKTFFVLFRQS
jgi:hypothetical protein